MRATGLTRLTREGLIEMNKEVNWDRVASSESERLAGGARGAGASWDRLPEVVGGYPGQQVPQCVICAQVVGSFLPHSPRSLSLSHTQHMHR